MNIFPPSTCKWSEPFAGSKIRRALRALRSALHALLFFVVVAVSSTPAQIPKPLYPRGGLPPFLEEFKVKEAPTLTQEIKLQSAVGRVSGYLARPDTQEKLPAVLLIHDVTGLTPWMKQNAREISTIGYVVLALDLGHRTGVKPSIQGEEAILAELSAAVRWLRRRPDVFPERIGALGWSWGGSLAVALAAATPLQACITCDGPIAVDPALTAGLRGTAILGIFSANDEKRTRRLPDFRNALKEARLAHKICVYEGARPGFMGPPATKAYVEKAAEEAWFEIYEFLGKHVEDACHKQHR